MRLYIKKIMAVKEKNLLLVFRIVEEVIHYTGQKIYLRKIE